MVNFTETPKISVAEYVASNAKSFPQRLAIISDGQSLTYEIFWNRCCELAATLLKLDLDPGGRVAVCLNEKIEFTIASITIMGQGLILVPIDIPEQDGQEWIIQNSDAQVVLHDDTLTADPAHFPEAKFVSIKELENEFAPPVWPKLTLETPATIGYTSGTQSLRKGVLLSHGNLTSSALFINQVLGYTEEVIEYVAAPLNHAFGFCRIRCIFVAGGTMASDSGPYNAAKAVQVIEKHMCNALTGPAACIAVLTERFAEGLKKFGKQMRWMEIGSQTLREEYKKILLDAFPNACMVQNYGMTEAVRCTFVDFNADWEHVTSCGRAAPGVSIRIRKESGQLAGPGEVGIIEMKGPQVALAYWRNEEAWKARYSEGWFQSDDLGYQDGDGYLYYVSRRDDMINMAGEKVSPTDLEDKLISIINDLPFCICAVDDPDKVRGEVPAICFEGTLPDSFSWLKLRKSLIATLPNKLLPKVAFQIPEFPRTQVGKIQRKKLRTHIEGQFAVRID